MKNGTMKSHFSILFTLDEETLTDLLSECKSKNKSITIGVIVESEDAKYKTVSSSRVSIDRLVLTGDASDTVTK